MMKGILWVSANLVSYNLIDKCFIYQLRSKHEHPWEAVLRGTTFSLSVRAKQWLFIIYYFGWLSCRSLMTSTYPIGWKYVVWPGNPRSAFGGGTVSSDRKTKERRVSRRKKVKLWLLRISLCFLKFLALKLVSSNMLPSLKCVCLGRQEASYHEEVSKVSKLMISFRRRKGNCS